MADGNSPDVNQAPEMKDPSVSREAFLEQFGDGYDKKRASGETTAKFESLTPEQAKEKAYEETKSVKTEEQAEEPKLTENVSEASEKTSVIPPDILTKIINGTFLTPEENRVVAEVVTNKTQVNSPLSLEEKQFYANEPKLIEDLLKSRREEQSVSQAVAAENPGVTDEASPVTEAPKVEEVKMTENTEEQGVTAETPEEKIARVEKKIADTIAEEIEKRRTSGRGEITSGEKLTIAQKVYLEELEGYSVAKIPGFKGEFGRFFAFLSGNENVEVKNDQGEVIKKTKINWMFQHPSQELVDFLKSKFENNTRGVKEEVEPQQSSEVAPAPAPTEVPKMAAPAETPRENNLLTTAELREARAKAIGEENVRELDEIDVKYDKGEMPEEERNKKRGEILDRAKKEPTETVIPQQAGLTEADRYTAYLASLKYSPEAGATPHDPLKLRNEEREYVIDEKTGKPFEFKFYNEVNAFLENKSKEEQAKINPFS